jgi:hypothetical protein
MFRTICQALVIEGRAGLNKKISREMVVKIGAKFGRILRYEKRMFEDLVVDALQDIVFAGCTDLPGMVDKAGSESPDRAFVFPQAVGR